MLDLSIDNIKPKQEFKHPKVKHPVLPWHEFSMLIVAPKGSGKTNFICNLLLKHYKGYFHQIFVCSPTVENDEKWDVVKQTKHVLAENKALKEALLATEDTSAKRTAKREPLQVPIVYPDDEQLEEESKKQQEPPPFDGKIPDGDFFADLDQVPQRIAEQQKVIRTLRERGYGQKAKYLADRLLVVLDDQAGMFKGGNVNNPMVNYVIKHRHSSSSVIIVTQAYKAIPKTIRTNCNALILFEIPNLSELKVIYEENPEGMNEEDWMTVYEHAVEEPFSFLYINNKFPKHKRVYRKFDALLTVHDDSATDDEPEDQAMESEPTPNPVATRCGTVRGRS